MLKVLIADDEERICKLIQILGPWQALGMEVCATAANGIEALELIKTKEPDILITDIRMPGCDGLTLISRAKELQPNLEIIIISGYAHFEYARTSIQYGVSDYLLKPVNKAELEVSLTKCAKRCRSRHSSELEREQLIERKGDLSRLRHALARDLVDNRLTAVTAESLDQSYHFFARPGDAVQVFLLKISAKEDPKDDALKVIQDRFQSIFSTALEDLCHDFLLVFRQTDGYGIMSFDPKRRANIRKALRHCMSQLEAEKNLYGALRSSIALGTPELVENLQGSYQSAAMAIMERLTEGTGKLLEGIPAPSALPTQSILDRYSRDIQHAVDILSVEAAISALEQLRRSAMEVRDVRSRELIYLVHTAADLFTAALALENRDDILRQFSETTGRCSTVTELFVALDSLQRKLMDRVMEERQAEELRPIRLAKQYIHEHFSDPITLEEVAEAAGFSGSYFSTYFKKETGMGFNQYLTQVRIAEAKFLLRDTETPVSEVCRKVGYQDLKHFNRLFSKDAGLTPGEYRKLYK